MNYWAVSSCEFCYCGIGGGYGVGDRNYVTGYCFGGAVAN